MKYLRSELALSESSFIHQGKHKTSFFGEISKFDNKVAPLTMFLAHFPCNWINSSILHPSF